MKIVISSHYSEAAAFAAYLKSLGHDAEIGDHDIGDDDGRLWDDYVENGHDFWPKHTEETT